MAFSKIWKDLEEDFDNTMKNAQKNMEEASKSIFDKVDEVFDGAKARFAKAAMSGRNPAEAVRLVLTSCGIDPANIKDEKIAQAACALAAWVMNEAAEKEGENKKDKQ